MSLDGDEPCTHEVSHFDRSLCGLCDGMHTYCADCRKVLDDCEEDG